MSEKTEAKPFLKKENRQICWDSRDLFFACMQKNKDSPEKCGTQEEAFKASCPPVWHKHFMRKLEYERMRNERLNTVDAIDKEKYAPKSWFLPMFDLNFHYIYQSTSPSFLIKADSDLHFISNSIVFNTVDPSTRQSFLLKADSDLCFISNSIISQLF